MKITMIGDSAVGKTTFMTTTYGLMRNGLKGFRIECRDKQADKKLVDAYDLFCRKGFYPNETVKMKSYEYDFYSDLDWVMRFTLNDIRGESIHDYDINDLLSQIRESDAVMLFLSALDIIQGQDLTNSIDDLHMILNNSFIVDERPKMLLVVFTKCDAVDFDKNPGVKEKLRATVSDLEAMSEKNDNFLFDTVMTACAPHKMMNLDYAMGLLMLIGYARDVSVRRDEIIKEYEEILELWGGGLWRALKQIFWVDLKRQEAAKRVKVLHNVEIPKYNRMVEKFETLKTFCENYKQGTSYSRAKSGNVFEL